MYAFQHTERKVNPPEFRKEMLALAQAQATKAIRYRRRLRFAAFGCAFIGAGLLLLAAPLFARGHHGAAAIILLIAAGFCGLDALRIWCAAENIYLRRMQARERILRNYEVLEQFIQNK